MRGCLCLAGLAVEGDLPKKRGGKNTFCCSIGDETQLKHLHFNRMENEALEQACCRLYGGLSHHKTLRTILIRIAIVTGGMREELS